MWFVSCALCCMLCVAPFFLLAAVCCLLPAACLRFVVCCLLFVGCNSFAVCVACCVLLVGGVLLFGWHCLVYVVMGCLFAAVRYSLCADGFFAVCCQLFVL